MQPIQPKPCAPRGATLIEVLVSVLVLAVGLLGAAALQASALRNNQSNYERAQMTVLAQGMLDAMRNNLAGVDAGNYAMAEWTCTAPAAGNLANADMARWMGDLQGQIHAGACGSIVCAARVCTVGLNWDDSRATAGNAAMVLRIVSRL
jgi:type IV pilus assembly protein PilV